MFILFLCVSFFHLYTLKIKTNNRQQFFDFQILAARRVYRIEHFHFVHKLVRQIDEAYRKKLFNYPIFNYFHYLCRLNDIKP